MKYLMKNTFVNIQDGTCTSISTPTEDLCMLYIPYPNEINLPASSAGVYILIGLYD
jgi:hypothetical protein